MAKQDLLTPEVLRKLLRYDPETGKLFWRERTPDVYENERYRKTFNSQFAGKEAFTATSRGYKVGAIYDRVMRAHRVIFAIYHGYWPKEVDHINRDRSDNRVKNLREVTRETNNKNLSRRNDNKSGVPGVNRCKRSGGWQVHISINKKRISLGRFPCWAKAVKVRNETAKEHGYLI